MKLSLFVSCAMLSCAVLTAQKPFEAMGPRGNNDGVCPQPNTTTLCIPLDGSFSVPSMDANGGSGQANPADPCQFNDDDSSGAIPLQFGFDLYGTVYNDVYINNNGNVSFGQAFATFTSTGFPVSGFPMVAPFWGDVDTGSTANNNGGTVWFRSEANRFVVIWDHVGYYNENYDKTNTFQLIITDGTDPLIGIGNNVCFCYDDMQWTTGDASQGMGGFGGVPATVGVNEGNGTDFFQIGLFDQTGNVYDGPGGNNDGVDYLDNRTICFSAANLPGNQPPIATGLPPNNKYEVGVGMQLVISIDWIPPEAGQNVASITVNSGGLANFACDPPTVGVPIGNITCTFDPANNQVGNHLVDITATDDDPFDPRSTTITICINVSECYLFLGLEETSFQLGPDPDDIVVVVPLEWTPVTTTAMPTFQIPNIPGLIGVQLIGQVGMWNPIVFPTNPLQMSNGLRVTIGQGTEQFGPTTNLDLSGDPMPALGSSYHFYFAFQ